MCFLLALHFTFATGSAFMKENLMYCLWHDMGKGYSSCCVAEDLAC